MRRVVGLVLTPHGSSLGSQEYFGPGRGRPRPGRARFVAVPPWYAEPGLVALVAERVNETLASVAAGDDPRRYPVIFTAHSLPERVRDTGDTYPEPAGGVGRAGGGGGRHRPLAGGLAERRAHAGALAGSRRARRGAPAGGDWRRERRPRGRGLPHRLRGRPSRGALRPRHRAGRRGRRGRAVASPAPPRSTTIPVSSASWPTSSAPPRRDGAEPTVRRVVVVGGGISGLAAAWELSGGGDGHGRGPTSPSLEASSRLGGALDSREVRRPPGGHRTRRLPRPPARGRSTCAGEIGLGDALVPVAGRRGRGVGRRAGAPAAPWPGAGHPHPILAHRPIRHPRAARPAGPGARRAAPPARRPRPHRRPVHRATRGPQARAAGGRPPGRPPHRRHPRRLGGRHVGRGRLPPAPSGGPQEGQPDARPARRAPRRHRRTIRRRCSGPSRAAWRRWSSASAPSSSPGGRRSGAAPRPRGSNGAPAGGRC